MENRELTLNIFLISLLSMIISLKMYIDSSKMIDKYNIALDSRVIADIWYKTGFMRLTILGAIVLISGIKLWKERD